ncbi:MAG: PEP-CTERM sorting domain-containing protein [Verrucomicrobiaceae bacterium]|nr:MAG: PEP-CTERM sorting domain-containing protein [Verrucomicrobiaceae bacterium]
MNFLSAPVSGMALFAMSALSSSAAITVASYGIALPQSVSGQILVEGAGLPLGYARIENSSHIDFGGTSSIKFGRYQLPDTSCVYWFRGADTLGSVTYLESWQYVYWQGFGDGTLVDGAVWGDDNFLLMHDGSQAIGVLQFNFDQASGDVTLLASAVDPAGISFADGVAAIQAVPEPSAMLIAGAGLVLLATGRRRK